MYCFLKSSAFIQIIILLLQHETTTKMFRLKIKIMNEQMIQIVQSRVNEMIKDVQIQKIMISFESTEVAQEWIIKMAVATLIIPVEQR